MAGGGFGARYEIDHHPGLRRRLFGCGSTPALQPSRYRLVSGSLDSRAMKAPIPWTAALPPAYRRSEPVPLLLALPGVNGGATDFVTQTGLPGYATAAGIDVAMVSSGDVGSTYYHPRRNGTSYLAFLLDELVPMIERRFAVGGARKRRAVYGLSMGGFGALLVAQQRPDLVGAAVGSSPAVFSSYHAAVTGHPDTFDSDADWRHWGLWDAVAGMGAMPVRIDCGDADPFAPTAQALLGRIPNAVGAISSGCHDTGFWRRHAPVQLGFIADRLGLPRT